MKKEFIPKNCPRLKETVPGRFSYQIGKPWEDPFINISIGDGSEAPGMMGGDDLSGDTIFEFMRVMSSDFYACWMRALMEAEENMRSAPPYTHDEAQSGSAEFIKQRQARELATDAAKFWLKATNAEMRNE